jgi:Kef-type K+ transport system membrane component KefB
MSVGTLSPVLTLLLQLVVVVGVARVAGAIAQRLGQARVVGEMLAGFLLGPSLLGAVAPGLSSRLFPAHGLGALEGLSSIGLVLYMLLVGARMSPEHLRTRGRLVLGTSLAGTALPFALGFGIGLPLALRFDVPASSRSAFLAFMGLSLSVTALPVLVRIVREFRLDATAIGTAAVAAAAVSDLFAWAGLAIVTSLARTPDAPVGATLLRVGAYLLAMAAIVRPMLRWGLRRVSSSELRLGWVLLVALASAAATEWIGIHPLFGAFLAGLLVCGEAGLGAAITEQLEPIATQLLLPLFFALTGLRMDVTVLPSGTLAADLVLVVGAAVLGKVAGPALVARLEGESWREALILGTLMNTRGLVEIALLVVGLDAGLLPRPLFTLLVLMAFVTTAMTVPLLRLLGVRPGAVAHASVSPDPA